MRRMESLPSSVVVWPSVARYGLKAFCSVHRDEERLDGTVTREKRGLSDTYIRRRG